MGAARAGSLAYSSLRNLQVQVRAHVFYSLTILSKNMFERLIHLESISYKREAILLIGSLGGFI